MTVRETRKKQSEQRILDAAARVFAQTGYRGARVDAIADAAGVNKAMIYYHIGDKKALYTRVLHQVFGDTAARMEDAIGRVDSPSEKIRAYIHSIGQTIADHPQLPRIMMAEFATGGRHLPDIVVRDLLIIIGLVGDVIRQGREQGQFVPFDPLVLHLMVIGAISFFKVSEPVRRRHATFMALSNRPDGARSPFDLLHEIEGIILRALTGA